MGCQIVGICGPANEAFYGTITNSVGNTVNFDSSNGQLGPGSGYILGKLTELDAPGEWYQGTNAGSLYLWFPPGGAIAEGRVQDLGFDLHNQSYINVLGLNFCMACSLGPSNAVLPGRLLCTDRYPRAFLVGDWGIIETRGMAIRGWGRES